MVEDIDVIGEYLLLADYLLDLLLGQLFGVADVAGTEYIDELGVQLIAQLL